MDWIYEPQAWISLLTLTGLEIVLGIDNIIFISILAGKLPAEQQAKARQTGLMLAQPYQQKGLLQDAMKSAAGRLSQIQSLMGQINATSDQKAVQEIQARIGAENALLAHEMSQVQMLQGMADSEERIARSRERERQYQMLVRTGKVADYLP